MPVSIIIPAYNEEKYIEETLKALPSEHEIIVVCNGCTDNTASVAKKYTDNVIETKDKGVSMARNLGASKATHDKLIFLDADIVINGDVIETIEKSKYKLGCIKLKPNKNKLKFHIWCLLRNLWGNFYGGGVIFCTKSVFDKAKGFEKHIKYKEDKRFLIRAKKYTQYKLLNKYGTVNMRRNEKESYFKQIKRHLRKITNKQMNYKPIR